MLDGVELEHFGDDAVELGVVEDFLPVVLDDGVFAATYRNFVMLAGRRYEVDIIDTWNMTIDTLPDPVEGRFRLELPGRQFMAVRLRAVG